MSGIITKAFENWLVNRTLAGERATADRMIFALVPDQDENAEIDPEEGIPPAGQIRHEAAITQTAALNGNAVVYSVVLDTTVGNWDYNWIGLVDSITGTLLMIVHLATQQKIKTQNGQQGNSLVRNLMMEFESAAEAAQITVTPETWQIDFSARLHSMDESRRMASVDYYGPAAFRADSFSVTLSGDDVQVAPGLGYVAGLRALLRESVTLSAAQPTGIWVDICWQGSVNGGWENVFTLRAADSLEDYTDAAGFPHFVTCIAEISSGAVTDLRQPFPLEAVQQVIDDLDVWSKTESDVRFLFAAGDTATGEIGAPVFRVDIDEAPPWAGTDFIYSQIESAAPFCQAAFTAPIGDYLPVVKGRALYGELPMSASYGYRLRDSRPEVPAPVIHTASYEGEREWEFSPESGRIVSGDNETAFLTEAVQIGMPLLWPSDTMPAGYFALMVGQAFNTTNYPALLKLYPSGYLPDMRGRTPLGKTADRALLSLADGEVKSHGHGGAVGATDLGSPSTTVNGSHTHGGVPLRNSTYELGGNNRVYFDPYASAETDAAGDHAHSVPLGAHGHALQIDAFGAAKNTVDNIAFNWIVRLK